MLCWGILLDNLPFNTHPLQKLQPISQSDYYLATFMLAFFAIRDGDTQFFRGMMLSLADSFFTLFGLTAVDNISSVKVSFITTEPRRDRSPARALDLSILPK